MIGLCWLALGRLSCCPPVPPPEERSHALEQEVVPRWSPSSSPSSSSSSSSPSCFGTIACQKMITIIITITIMLLRTQHPLSLITPVVTLPPLQNPQKYCDSASTSNWERVPNSTISLDWSNLQSNTRRGCHSFENVKLSIHLFRICHLCLCKIDWFWKFSI